MTLFVRDMIHPGDIGAPSFNGKKQNMFSISTNLINHHWSAGKVIRPAHYNSLLVNIECHWLLPHWSGYMLHDLTSRCFILWMTSFAQAHTLMPLTAYLKSAALQHRRPLKAVSDCWLHKMVVKPTTINVWQVLHSVGMGKENTMFGLRMIKEYLIR